MCKITIRNKLYGNQMLNCSNVAKNNNYNTLTLSLRNFRNLRCVFQPLNGFFLLLFWLTRHNHTAHENLQQTQTFDHHLKHGSHHFYRRNSFFGSCCLFWIFFYMYLFSSFNYFSMFLSFFISFFFLLVSI